MQDNAPVALRERIRGNVRSRRGFRFNTLSLAIAAAAAIVVIALTVPFALRSNAAIETRDYLAFVVSNKTKDDTLHIASNIAQPLRDFLKDLEA
jgi:hypothetical protein